MSSGCGISSKMATRILSAKHCTISAPKPPCARRRRSLAAAADLRDKLRAVAAELLEGPVERIELSQGRFVLAGNPPRALSMTEVVAQAASGTGSPIRGTMSVTTTPPHVTAFCAQAAEVEV